VTEHAALNLEPGNSRFMLKWGTISLPLTLAF